jgi:general secretion pathway protein F
MPDDPPIPFAQEAVIPYAGYHHTQARGMRRQSTFLSALFVGLWVAAGAMALGALAGVVWFASSQLFAASSPLLGVLLLLAAATLLRGVRRNRAVAALNYLEQAVRLNLPLPPMIRAAEQSEPGRLRKKLARLRERLEDGHLVADALDDAVPGLPPRAISLIAAAERNGRLASTLTRLATELRKRPVRDPSRAILMRWYPVVLVVGLSVVLGAFGVYVLPKLQQIFHDFRIPLPPITVVTMQVWMWLGPPLGVLAAVAALVVSGRIVAEAVAPRFAHVNLGPAADLPQWIAWWLPVARGVARNRGLADLCHVLADAASAGRPLHPALRDAARLNINIVLRQKTDAWADAVERGTPLAEAALEAGFPKLLAGMLATTSAHGSADTPEVFTFLARYYDGRFSRAAALLEGALLPAMVLVFAFFVGSAALGLFMPMIELMDRTGGLTGLN